MKDKIDFERQEGLDEISNPNPFEGLGHKEAIVEDLNIEDAVEEIRDENEVVKFKNFCEGRNYLIIEKLKVSHFINLISYHRRLGYDIYSSSFKMDMEGVKDGAIRFVYNNGNVLSMSEVVVKEAKGDWNSYIVSIDNMTRIYSASQGYIFIYEEERSMYGYVFGGKVFLETFIVEKDICSKEYLMDKMNAKMESKTEVSKDFIDVMKNLSELVHTGTRIEERALYFVGEHTYIFSGIVLGRFKGVGLNMTLQDADVSSLMRFFFDVDSNILVEDHVSYVKYSNNGRCIYMGRRGLTLSDDMKYNHIDTVDSVNVNCDKIKTIVSFLISIGNNSGILNIKRDNNGVTLVCSQKVEEYFSSFKVSGAMKGNGISDIRVPLDILKNFLKVFKEDVVLKTLGSKLYVEGEIGEILIFGNM